MINVNMTTNEKDIPVNYGMYDFGVVRDHALSSLKYILADITDIKQRYIALGFHLWEFKENECYKDFGFDNFKEFCKENLPIDYTIATRCIKIWHRFALEQGGVRKMFLDDKYREYEYTQLSEMVSMDSTELAMVNPDMTCKEMRQLKKKVLVEPEALKKFVEYFQEDETPLTKRELHNAMIKAGNQYSHFSAYPYNHDMRPGKASICGSKYYKFNQLIEAYEKMGGTLYSDKVASTQLKKLCVTDLVDKKGAVLHKCIKSAEPEKENIDVKIFDEDGKLYQFSTVYKSFDILLQDDNTLVLRVRKGE